MADASIDSGENW